MSADQYMVAAAPDTGQSAPETRRSYGGFWPALPAWTVLFGGLYSVVTGQITFVGIGNYNLQLPELVLLSFIPAAYTLAKHAPLRITRLTLLPLLFVALWAVSMVRGMLDAFGPALISARANAVLPAFLLLALFRVDGTMRDRLLQAVTACAFAVGLILVLRLIFGPTLFYQIAFRDALEVNDGGRAITAHAALILATAMLIEAARFFALKRLDRRKAGWHLRKGLLFGALLLLSLQGTATLAGIAGLIAIFAFAPGKSLAFRQALVIACAFALLVVTITAPEVLTLEFYSALLPDALNEQLGRRAANFETRTMIASGFLRAFQFWDALDQILGLPAGRTASVVIDLWGGTYWTASLHSGYLGVLQSLGYAGLATLLLMLVTTALAALVAVYGRHSSYGALSLGLVVMLAVYAIGYDLRNEAGLYLWIALLTAAPRGTDLRR